MENKLKISENTVVHCVTKEEANEVLKIADSLGYKWCDGGSYIDSYMWYTYNVDTCYDLNKGVFGELNEFTLPHYKIISAQDFIALHKENDFKKGGVMGIKESDGKKDYSEINLEILDLMADRFAANKHKYPKGNMKKPIDIKNLEWALFRHVKKLVQPLKNDEESYEDHLAAILCNASMILDQLKHNETHWKRIHKAFNNSRSYR